MEAGGHMEAKLADRVALVTGAGAGIGRASAMALAAHGAKVVVADVDADGGAATVAMIRDAGGEAVFVQTDVSLPDQAQHMVAEAVRHFGGLDIAHNNAGVAGLMADVADLPLEEWDRVMGVMLRGVFVCMQAEIPAMLERGGGSIINTGSGAGLVGFPGQSAYVASKHGVQGLTKVAALEYGKRGIRVNSVCPGTVWSPMVRHAIDESPELEEYLVGLHPIGRIGEAEEIAAAVVWLASDDSSFVLGHALSVDGGYVVP